MASPTQWTRIWANCADNGGQKGLVCCSPWGCKVSDRTEWLNKTTKINKNIIDWVPCGQHKLFLTVVRVDSQSQGTYRFSIWWKSDPWFTDSCLLAESSFGGRGRELSGVSFIRALIPFVRAPSSWPYYLPKALPPNIITLGIGFQHMDCGEKVA